MKQESNRIYLIHVQGVMELGSAFPVSGASPFHAVDKFFHSNAFNVKRENYLIMKRDSYYRIVDGKLVTVDVWAEEAERLERLITKS